MSTENGESLTLLDSTNALLSDLRLSQGITTSVLVGTEKVVIGTEDVVVGTEQVVVGTERVVVGTQQVLAGYDVIGVGSLNSAEYDKLFRELDAYQTAVGNGANRVNLLAGGSIEIGDGRASELVKGIPLGVLNLDLSSPDQVRASMDKVDAALNQLDELKGRIGKSIKGKLHNAAADLGRFSAPLSVPASEKDALGLAAQIAGALRSGAALGMSALSGARWA